MTPDEFARARRKLGLSQDQLARVLGLGTDGGRTVRRWEAPEGTTNARPPNPVACRVMEWLLAGFRPPEFPHQ